MGRIAPQQHYQLTPPVLPQRLRTRKEQDPQQFEILFNIIDEEVSRNDHNHSKSCTKGLLWLKRCAAALQNWRPGNHSHQHTLTVFFMQQACFNNLKQQPLAQAHNKALTHTPAHPHPPTHPVCLPAHTGPWSS